MKISVITPVYNVKAFIGKCATSLMAQTFGDAEYIFVDDASSDGSIGILEGILAQHPEKNARIVHHEKNSGLPAARRTGIGEAKGDYVFNCDGDDWVEPTLLEDMYAAVSKNDADYAYCDFFLNYENSERYMKCPEYTTPDEMLRKGFLCGTAKYNVWNKLIRRSLYDGVEFPVDHRKGGEDMIMIGMLSKARSIAYVPRALYHYVKTNAEAISEKFSQQRLIDIRYNADHAIAALDGYPGDLTREIALFKLNVKLPFLISDEDRRHEVWKEWYPEANGYATANTLLPFRTRLLQWMAAKDQWWYVKAYYRIVYKLVYRLRYR